MQSYEEEKNPARHVRNLQVVLYSWSEGCPLWNLGRQGWHSLFNTVNKMFILDSDCVMHCNYKDKEDLFAHPWSL